MIDYELLAQIRKTYAITPPAPVDAAQVARVRVHFGLIDPCVTSLSHGLVTS